jgi:endo-1,4-beta-xylanase
MTSPRPALARRGVLASLAATALTACSRPSQSQTPRAFDASIDAALLKSVAHFPVGCAVSSGNLPDPAFAALLTRNFSQITPEWEMKMEYILKDDGTFRFDAPDAIAAFARDHGLRLFCHTLVWYAENAAAFTRIDGQGKVFADAYANYILTVAGRYKDQAVAWDVVNEAVNEDGEGLRDCLWSRNLGGQIDYMRRAYDIAHEADPNALLLINDYYLERLPKKRATYLRMVETLLKAGAPLGGLGNQSHLFADLAPGAITAAIADLASMGLPIHVSELDISLNWAKALFVSRDDLVQRQARLAGEIGEAFAKLKPAQRFAFTTWGLRDKDSWLRSQKENPTPPWDAPLLFDDDGRPKPMLVALEQGLTR